MQEFEYPIKGVMGYFQATPIRGIDAMPRQQNIAAQASETDFG